MQYYDVIYDLTDAVKAAMAGELGPLIVETVVGRAEVREVFSAGKHGKAAGLLVTEGYIRKALKARIMRDDVIIYNGTIASLRRFKDDVAEVRAGLECGVTFEGHTDIKAGRLPRDLRGRGARADALTERIERGDGEASMPPTARAFDESERRCCRSTRCCGCSTSWLRLALRTTCGCFATIRPPRRRCSAGADRRSRGRHDRDRLHRGEFSTARHRAGRLRRGDARRHDGPGAGQHDRRRRCMPLDDRPRTSASSAPVRPGRVIGKGRVVKPRQVDRPSSKANCSTRRASCSPAPRSSARAGERSADARHNETPEGRSVRLLRVGEQVRHALSEHPDARRRP